MGGGNCPAAGGRLVKTVRVGKKRSFLRGLVLTILTFGVYAVYWWYKAPHETYRQFDLEDEGRDEGVVWLVVGLLFSPLLLVYFWKAVSNVRYVRSRLALREGIKPGAFLTLAIGPYTVATMLYLAGALMLLSVAPDATDLDQVADPAAEVILTLWTGAAVIFLGGLLTAMVAFWMLQRDINEVWDAWAARMRELAAPAAPTPLPSPPPAAAAPAHRASAGGCARCGSGPVAMREGSTVGSLEYTCRNCGHRWMG